MKKLITGLAIVALIFIFSGCDKSDETKNNNTTTDTTITAPTVNEEDYFSNKDSNEEYHFEEAVTISFDNETVTSTDESVQISDGKVEITTEGTYVLTGIYEDGQIVVNTDKTQKVQLIMNNVEINNSTNAPIYIIQSDKVFITLAENSVNKLSNTGQYNNENFDDNVDGVIFSKDDLTINGTGTLEIISDYGNGIVSKDDLVITNGNFEINVDGHGLEANDEIAIKDATFNIVAKKDGLHADNDDDESLGNIYLQDGEFTITAGSDGVKASNSLIVNGATINVINSYEGLEARTVDILSGNIKVNADDDGINASDGTPQETQTGVYIAIFGGQIEIDAVGDGIDSNDQLYICGGQIFVNGPTTYKQHAVDWSANGTISGGTLIAVGSNFMALNFTENSTQNSILVNFETGSVGDVVLKDSNGEIVLTYTPSKIYDSVLFSSPNLEIGEEYILEAGSNSESFTLSEQLLTISDVPTKYDQDQGFGGGGRPPRF